MEHEEIYLKNEEKNNNPESIENMKREANFKFSPLVFIVIAAVLIGVIVSISHIVFRGSEETETLKTQTSSSDLRADPTSTPFPFQEMTIPYLRNREYESNMAELNQISSNGNYTSYLTSYTSDGLKINGLLTQPTGTVPEGGHPAIIFVHGYIPPANYVTTSNYASYVDYLAKSGFVVFKIDLRGHGSSEGDASGAYYSGDYIVDVLSAREALKDLDFVNSENIGLWGHSMAGNVTFRSFTVAQEIKAVSIWNGAVYTYDDWQEYGLNDNSYRPPRDNTERQRRREELFSTHGEFDSSSDFWKMVVPTNYLEGVGGAVQLNHAVNDDVVSVEYSRELSEILLNSGIKYELNEYQTGGHNMTGSTFTQAMEDTVRFFRENL